jgi:hypothetical protein
MPQNGGLKFRIKRGDLEIELEGDFVYVKEKFEELMKDVKPVSSTPLVSSTNPITMQPTMLPLSLEGIIEHGADGRPRLTVPVDKVTAKEALGIMLYALHPTQLSDEELSSLLSSSWKTMKTEAVRARASELRRDGRLVADKGKYSLSGAGIQWIQNEVVGKVKWR